MPRAARNCKHRILSASEAPATGELPIVGRDALLDEIAAACGAGRSVVFDVQGLAGLGKSTLIAAIRRRLAAEPALVLSATAKGAGSGADDDRPSLLTAYRKALEGFAERLPQPAREAFVHRAREITAQAPTSGPGLDSAMDDLTDSFVAQVAGLAGTRVAVLVDDISNWPAPLTAWLLELVRKMALSTPVVAAVTRNPTSVELPFDGPVRVLPLPQLTRHDVTRLVAARAPAADHEAWATAIERWCGNQPGAVAVATSLAAERPHEPHVLEDSAVVIPRGRKLVERLVDSLGGESERAAVEVAAVARRFDATLVESLLDRLDPPPALDDWLGGLPFVVPDEDGYRRVLPYIRVLLTDRLSCAPPRGRETGTRLQELHELIADYHHEIAFELQDKQPYSSWARFENPSTRGHLIELLHHSYQLPNERAWSKVAHIYFDAFWWWGVYLTSDFCVRVLATWNDVARPGDRAMLDALASFQRSYPPIGRRDRGGWDGRITAPKEDWVAVERALDKIAGLTGLDRPPGKLIASERHVRAVIDAFRGEALRFQGRSDAAEKAFVDSEELFRKNRTDAWCIPWMLWERADLALARREGEHAEALARQGLDASAQAPPDDHDHEVDANLHRVLADARWDRDRAAAFEHYAQAVLAAYAFNSTPDEYTRLFYGEITGRALDRVLELAAGDRDAALKACEAFASLWGPYWEESGRAPDSACIALLLEQGREVAVCLFPSEPSDDDLRVFGPEQGIDEPTDSEYTRVARRVHERLAPNIAELARRAFEPASVATRLTRLLKLPARAPTPPAAVDLPSGHAEPDDLFEPPDDAVWPDHWRAFPRDWQAAAQDPASQAAVRKVVREAVAELPDGWRAVLEHRDLEGWTHQDVARRLGISRANQTVMLHHSRARIRRTLATFFDGAADAGA